MSRYMFETVGANPILLEATGDDVIDAFKSISQELPIVLTEVKVFFWDYMNTWTFMGTIFYGTEIVIRDTNLRGLRG